MLNIHMSKAITNNWSNVSWRFLRGKVFNIQCRIYQATKANKKRTTRNLQKVLLSSKSAKFVAMYRTTEIFSNDKSTNPNISNLIKLDNKMTENIISAVRNGSHSKHQLLLESTKQYLVRLVLEPEWESFFTNNEIASFGFRPGYCVHDAIQSILNQICSSHPYVFSTNIIRLDNKVNSTHLLQFLHLDDFPLLQAQIESWLNGGCLDKRDFLYCGNKNYSTLSFLLVNIILSRIPSVIKLAQLDFQNFNNGKTSANISIVQYGDSLVFSYPEINGLIHIKKSLDKFLLPIGLIMDQSEYGITHITNYRTHSKPGFNFLGVYIRKYRSITGRYKLVVTPKFSKVKEHLCHIRQVVRSNKSSPARRIIQLLNPIIQGWAYYYHYTNPTKIFNFCDFRIRIILRRWMVYRHPMKSWQWLRKKYFVYLSKDTHNIIKSDRFFDNNFRSNSLSYTFNSIILNRHTETYLSTWTNVDKRRSFFDGDFCYWRIKLQNFPELDHRKLI
uniref:Putative reverse transcriptase and intron maturase n=1 Tax=Eutreptiella pomquetensis TaxID=215699 RepID=A0A223FM14_9EUGL|nr:putative reverse transcriptase and intron maturase [Eutreptiella pomquetensis]